MLSLSSLNTHYGQAHILRDVSLEVKSGECVALLGRNGAGKSTTMKAIVGIVPATSGLVIYQGKDLRKLKPYRRARLGIGYVPEERRIFNHLTVRENLVAGERKMASDKVLTQEPWSVERVFSLFPALKALQDRQGRQLSGGEQQMLTVGRTLMTNPTCLLLDEPTEGLAPIVVQQVMDAIKQLKAAGFSILLSEQNRHTASALAEHAYVLEKGQIIYAGALKKITPEALKALGW
ncbi:MAG: ABC transporter ATP-binding protein [Alphaproteobacteria bacterium]|nr:ABC transporter ATP-binding protein [Alphaproteobacteria bacterium]